MNGKFRIVLVLLFVLGFGELLQAQRSLRPVKKQNPFTQVASFSSLDDVIRIDFDGPVTGASVLIEGGGSLTCYDDRGVAYGGRPFPAGDNVYGYGVAVWYNPHEPTLVYCEFAAATPGSSFFDFQVQP